MQWRYGATFSELLQKHYLGSGIAFVSQFEDAALIALSKGAADFALVTQAAINSALPLGLEAVPIGNLTMQLAAGISHPLVKKMIVAKPNMRKFKSSTAQILSYDFACTDRLC